ncbi:MAG: cyclase family protein [Thermoplasmata archaeon]
MRFASAHATETEAVTIIDISMPLSPGMAAFPGDPTLAEHRVRSIDGGDGYNVSALSLGTHAGTHVDPPLHFVPNGPGTDRLDLTAFNGPCEVVRVPDSDGEIGIDALARIPAGTTRVLFRTRNSTRWAQAPSFFPDYVALSVGAAHGLLEMGVRLVGIDALSIESDPTGTFPVHHALLEHGALILEGLCLAEAAPGAYELCCLPLKLVGGDGGPARAVLIPR